MVEEPTPAPDPDEPETVEEDPVAEDEEDLI